MPAKRALKFSVSNTALLLLLLIVFLGLLLRLAFQEPLFFNESINIVKTSWELSRRVDAGSFRFALFDFWRLPHEIKLMSAVTGLAYLFFGVSKLSTVLFGFVAYLCTTCFIFLIGRHLRNQAVGLMAALLWATLPLDVLFSSQILPVPALIVLLCAIVYFLLEKQLVIWLPLLVFGLFSDWRLFFPLAILCALSFYLVDDRFALLKKRMVPISIILLAILLLKPEIVLSALSLYYSSTLIRENLLFLPLILISLVLVARQSEKPRFLLAWLGIQALAFVFFSPPIVESSQFRLLGVSGYWLWLLVPACLLIAWQVERLLGQKPLLKVLWIAAPVHLLLALNVFVQQPEGSYIVFVFSRIGMGLATVFIWLYLLSLQYSKAIQLWATAFLLVLVPFSSLQINKAYVDSYRYQQDDAESTLHFFEDTEEDVTVWVADEDLYSRFLYLSNFEGVFKFPRTTYLVELDPKLLDEPLAGDYVVAEEDVVRLVMGILPGDWQEVGAFATSDRQRLLLFLVGSR